MKRLFALLSAGLLLAGVWGCSSEGTLSMQLELSESSLSFDADGGKEKITVTTDGEWLATSSAEDWCTVKQSGSTLNVTVAKNYQTAERTATITVTSDEQEAAIAVAQAAGDGEYNAFSVTSNVYRDLAPTGGAEIELLDANTAAIPITVDIKDDNCVWSMKVIEGTDFIAANEIVNADTRKNFTLSVAENIAAEAREGKIKIWSEYQGLECSYILTIKQPEGAGEYVAFTVMSEEYPYITETEVKDEAGNIIYTRDKAFFATCTPCEVPIRVVPAKSHYKWSAEVVEGADFITIPELVDYSGIKTFSVKFAENTTSAERVGKVKISSLYQGFEYAYEFTFKQQKYMQHTPKDDEIKVMSFNVWVNRTGALSWNNRKQACYEAIRYHRPALLGIQEAMCKNHWRDMVDALKDDGYEGYGLSPYENVDAYVSTRGGTSGVFYDTALFEKFSYGTFWISETPDVAGSKSWNSNDIRIGTWLILKHKSTNKKICYINTHLDHKSSEARIQGMKLIMSKFEELGKDCDYWISTGDYNTAETDTAFNAIKGKMKNARSAAPATRTDNSRTYHAANATRASNPIDHILCSESMEVVEYHTIIENFPDVPYLSDHYPVYSIIKL